MDALIHAAHPEAPVTDPEPEADAQETLLLVPLLPPPGYGPARDRRPQRVLLRPAPPRAPRDLWNRPLTLAALACLCLMLLAGALDGMQQYALIRAQTHDAVAHIHAAQRLLEANRAGHPLDLGTLRALDAELAAADQDARQLSAELGAPSGVVLVVSALPGLSARLAAAAAFASAADSACQAGRSLVAGSLLVLQLRADGFLDARGWLTSLGARSPKAAEMIQRLQTEVTRAVGRLDAAASSARSADPAVLPASVRPASVRPGRGAALSPLLAAESRLRAGLASGGWRALARVALGAAAPNTLLAA